MELIKPNIFIFIKILQLMGRIFGMSCNYKNRFWFYVDSVLFAMALIWFGGCTFLTELCWPGCHVKFPNQKMIPLIFIVRLTQLGTPICIILYRCSNLRMNQIFHLNHWLKEKNAGFVSFKYTRRNFVMTATIIGWLVNKVIQRRDIQNSNKPSNETYLKFTCVSTSMWPLMILSWQFLAWMQVLNRALKISADQLKRAIIKSLQRNPRANYEKQITESVSQVKAVLNFKMNILHIYGVSIVFSQLKAIIWIMSNAVWFYFSYDTPSIVIYLGSVLLFNIPMCYLPHWAGQDISSEVSLFITKYVGE